MKKERYSANRLSRIWSMQVLYQIESQKNDISINEILEDFWKQDQETFPAKDSPKFTKAQNACTLIVQNFIKNQESIDSKIKQVLNKNWHFNRLNIIDKSILRSALSEAQIQDLSPILIISESLEIAKNYSEEQSSSLINGILHNLLNGVKNENI